jgi:hypothetical protein
MAPQIGQDCMTMSDPFRRLTAILSADVRGYSGLMRLDETDTVREPAIAPDIGERLPEALRDAFGRAVLCSRG